MLLFKPWGAQVKQLYRKLPPDDSEAEFNDISDQHFGSKRYCMRPNFVVVLLATSNGILLLLLGVCLLNKLSNVEANKMLYCQSFLHMSRRMPNFSTAPARTILKNEVKVFTSGFEGDQSIYQGPPSETNNAAWEGLYNCKYCRLLRSHE